MAVAALTSQLAPTRRAAATWASGAFGLMFLTRAIADSSVSLHWLRLLTPLGWIEELHPLTGGSPIMLIPLAFFIFLLSGAAIYLAGRRDLGGQHPAGPGYRASPNRAAERATV